VSTFVIGTTRRGERGASMIFTLLSLSMVTVLGLGLTSVALSTVSQATAESETTEALAIADAGIEHGKQLLLYQDWPSLNVFLQRGDGAACTFDELADVPTGLLPAGYPAAGSNNFIPVAGRQFGQGSYFVQLCDNHSREVVAPAPYTDNNPNFDNDKVIYMRSVGFGPRGSRAAVELTLGAAAMPAVVVNGDLEVKGNPTVTGPAGSIHANGSLELSGNPCTHVYYASVEGTQESGNVQGGTACTAQDVDARPFSPPIRIPDYSPWQIAQWAVAEGRQVIHLKADGTVVSLNTGAAVPTPEGWGFNNGGQNVRWDLNAKTYPAILYIDANVSIGGNVQHKDTNGPVALTLLVAGSIKATGTPNMTPGLAQAPNPPHTPFTLTPLKYIGPVLMMAGHDMSLGADFTNATYQGLFYARHQIDVAGNPIINGQLIALNFADTGYPVNNNSNTMNPVPLVGGVMVISGSPTINYSGDGLQTVKALTWRECRANWDPTVAPGTSCGAP
jgi:hypothetical protein